ncbi:MAG TPA: hypothetical protein VGC92_11345, partial [Phenylobacterium sp.]
TAILRAAVSAKLERRPVTTAPTKHLPPPAELSHRSSAASPQVADRSLTLEETGSPGPTWEMQLGLLL